MVIDIDSDAALETLEELFADVQINLWRRQLRLLRRARAAFDVLFNTQSSRRVSITRMRYCPASNRAINIRLPYAGQADNAFNARTLDEES